MLRNLALMGVLLLGGATVSAQQGTARGGAPRAEPKGTLQLLNQRVPEVRFQETPLESIMDWLADYTKLNISVRWQTMSDAGVSRDKPISIQARNLRLSQLLWMIMNEAGGADVKLAYRASGNLLILSTAEDLGRELVTKVYDVSDLLAEIPSAWRQSGFNVTQGLGQGTAGGGGGGGGMFSQGQQQQQQQQGQNQQNAQGQVDPKLQALADVIQQTVEPDSWEINGGSGTIVPFEKALIVRNTILVHQLINGYLTEDEIVSR